MSRECDKWKSNFDTLNNENNNEIAKNSELERQLGVEREKFKAFQKSQEILNSSMKEELETVESRFEDLVHRNTMIGEDFRT